MTTHWTRSQKKLHSELFKTTLGNKIKTTQQKQTATETLDAINKALLQSADLVAPKRKTCIRKNNSSWFNDQLTLLKQERRRAEAAWKRCSSDKNHTIYKIITKKYHKEIFTAKKNHFSNIIANALNRPLELFKLVTQTMNPACLEAPNSDSQEFCNELSDYFINKI